MNKYKISINEINFKNKSMNNYKKLIFKYKLNRVSLIKKIMNKYDMYYIPVNDNLKEKKTKLMQINKNIPLKLLDKNFYNELDFSNISKKNIKIKPSIKSMLQFDEAKIIDLPININLPIEELIAYIIKIKKDYEEKNSNLEHPLEIFGKQFYQADKPSKSSEIEVANRDLMKKNIADAFYIYDVEKYFLDKKEELKKKKNDKISKLNNDDSFDEIQDIIEKYDNEIKKYSNEEFINYIKSTNKKFTSNKIDVARRYMKHYIKEEKYYEIITGIHSI